MRVPSLPQDGRSDRCLLKQRPFGRLASVQHRSCERPRGDSLTAVMARGRSPFGKTMHQCHDHDLFRPHHLPAQVLYDAFQAEAKHCKGRPPQMWIKAEIEAVWKWLPASWGISGEQGRHGCHCDSSRGRRPSVARPTGRLPAVRHCRGARCGEINASDVLQILWRGDGRSLAPLVAAAVDLDKASSVLKSWGKRPQSHPRSSLRRQPVLHLIGIAWERGRLGVMKRLEDARLAWRQAQAELKAAQDELETAVASATPSTADIEHAKKLVDRRQRTADELLQRYITQIAKSG
jgi:hypothetical protein